MYKTKKMLINALGINTEIKMKTITIAQLCQKVTQGTLQLFFLFLIKHENGIIKLLQTLFWKIITLIEHIP